MFRNRTDAGQQLAAALSAYANQKNGLILAIPRGGVIVGLEVSRALHLPLDVLLTQKLGAPGNPELALAALAETGFVSLNEDVLAYFPHWRQQIEHDRLRAQEEIARRQRMYRASRPLSPLDGLTILLVDDGVATGATYLAAVAAVKAAHAASVVAALPVAPPETARKIAREVDACIILGTPEPFEAVGLYYHEFSQVSDEEVLQALELSRQHVRQQGHPSA